MVRNDPNIPSLDLLELTDEAQTESVNSVFEGFTGTWCGQVESLGHNSTSAPDCTWASRGDTVGTSTGLIWRPVAGSFNLIPRAVSSIIDSADRSWCPDDGREIFDGNGDGTAACDRGAVEFMPASLAEGGVNGLYYNPDADGHYVYVLDNDHNTMVLWTTFDRDGNQAWIFGIGDLTAGRSISTQAYINLDGRITLDGNIEAAQAEEWGRLDVDMTNCWEGVVSFTSDRPEFGSGQFEIRRLAFVKQIGCIDSS